MSGVVDSLPAAMRPLFTEIIGAQNPDLLTALESHDEPSTAERVAVHDILSTEFSRNLGPDYEPTDRGKDIDELLGAFLTRWEIEGDAFREAAADPDGDSGH
jgi:hypothetical protein